MRIESVEMQAAIALIFIPRGVTSPQLRECIAEAEQLAAEQSAQPARETPPFWTCFMDNPRPKTIKSNL